MDPNKVYSEISRTDFEIGKFVFPTVSSIYYGVTSKEGAWMQTLGTLIEGSKNGFIYEGEF